MMQVSSEAVDIVASVNPALVAENRFYPDGSVRSARAAHLVPHLPGQIMPNPSSLDAAYSTAVVEIAKARGREPKSNRYALEVKKAAFKPFLTALSESCRSIVCQHHPDGSWARAHSTPALMDIHVLAAGSGSGKTTLAKAFAVGLTRVSESSPYPLGCVILVHHIATAQKAFEELQALVPDKVAIFSTEHDANRSTRDERMPGFAVDELQDYPILVVTHEFYKGIRGEKARSYTRAGMTLPRVLTFIDEKVNEVEVYDVDKVALSQVWQFIQRDDHGLPDMADAVKSLVKFHDSKSFGARSIETRAHDPEAWDSTIETTGWLRTEREGLARGGPAAEPW